MNRSPVRKEKAGHRIAVVEEVADNIYSIKFILQSLGYDVASFAASAQYLEDLTQYEPELIIVDMMIPGRGGFSVIRNLCQGTLCEIPLLAITADAMEGVEQEIFDAGGNDVLSKPYSVGELQKKLDKWLTPTDDTEPGATSTG